MADALDLLMQSYADDDNARRQRQLAQMASQQGGPKIPPLEEPQATSLLQSVADKGLGALHYVGGVLDKTFGARAIRGAIGGKPRELLSVLPGSDLLGLTREADRVSGEDLLKQSGSLDPKEEGAGFEMRDLAGPALELAMDPATYLTLGTSSALTAAGKAASKAGTLAPTMAGRIAAGQSGLAGLGIPFRSPSVILGTGPTAQAVAGSLGSAGDRLLYSSLGRHASRLLDPSVGGLLSEGGQRAMRGTQDLLRSGTAEAKQGFLDIARQAEAGGILDDRALLRRALEMPGTTGNSLAEHVGQQMRDWFAARRAEATALGRPVGELADESILYGARQVTQPSRNTAGFLGGRRRQIDPTAPGQLGREDFLRNVPGGTERINEIIADPQLRQLIDAGNADAVAERARRYLGMTAADEAQLASWRQVAPPPGSPQATRMAQLEAWERQGGQLGDWLANIDPMFHAAGGMFLNNPLTDLATYGLRHARAQQGAEAIQQMFARGAVSGVSGTDYNAADALRRAGLTFNDAAAGTGAEANMLARLQASGLLPATADVSALRGVGVPQALVEDASRYASRLEPHESLNPLVRAWDSITNLTKAFQTSLWPTFHSRNVLTGLWQNAVIGAHDPRFHMLDPRAWYTPFRDAMSVRNNTEIQGAADIYRATHPGLTDAQATRQLLEEMFVHDARVGLDRTAVAEAVGTGSLQAPRNPSLPGSGGERTILDTVNPRQAIPSSWSDLNPLDVRGVGFGNPELALRDATGNPVMKYGQDLGHLGDDLNRMSAFIGLRRQGYSPAEAALRSKAAHYDYTRLSDFEREVMRRVVPFYNWTRQNLPFQLEQLAHTPGGITASAVKGLDNLRQGAGFTPDYISEGIAVPLGREDDGTQRFLTHFGLPIEDAFSFLGTGGNPVQRTMEKSLGMTNPLIKGPLEILANKQFYSGRSLDDLYSTTGSGLADQVLMNSPASRFLTMGRQVADERKSWGDVASQLLLPAKINDVDTNRARDVAVRQMIEQSLAGQPGVRKFEDISVKPEELPNLSPQEIELYRLYLYLEKRRAQQAKLKKQQGS